MQDGEFDDDYLDFDKFFEETNDIRVTFLVRKIMKRRRK